MPGNVAPQRSGRAPRVPSATDPRPAAAEGQEGIVDLHTAFSRAEKSKVYVQDVIRRERDAVWALIDKGAKIFICGDGSRMEPDVRRALTLIYSEEKDVSAEAAEAWMEQMMADNRYVLDVWASV